jgi:hypothetical protein
MKIILRESQLTKVLITETWNCDVFSNHTSAQDYDDVLLNLPTKQFRSMSGTIIQMTPREYLERCAQLQGNTLENQYNLLDKTKIRAIAESMSKGHKFDLPYIDYFSEHQEGRHRVLAAELHGCEVVKIAVFTEEGRPDPYTEDWNKDRSYTLKSLESELSDVYVDPQGVCVVYTHDWEHSRDVDKFLGLYPSFENKVSLFYACMDKLRLDEYTTEFEFDIDNFVISEDPSELTNYIWEEIKSHTTDESLYDQGYRGDDLDFQELMILLQNVMTDYRVLFDLHKSVLRMLNSVFTYTFHKNNREYFNQVDSQYKVILDRGTMRVYSGEKYSWEPGITTGKDLLQENNVILTNEIPSRAESHGYYLLDVSDINEYLGQYPIK